jgi:isopentenyl-diphosphate delta-isomerase
MLARRFVNMNKYDPTQVKTFSDPLFLVDSKDNLKGELDKKTAHLNSYIFSKEALPHRAFSVFLFNPSGQLLLQQRSSTKVTFPLYWTNSCCSHPLRSTSQEGTFQEAIERTVLEVGIQVSINENSGKQVGKVLYRAKFDEIWGEYELDYLYFFKLNQSQLNFTPNKEEVGATQWLSLSDVKSFVKETKLVTPWFKRITEQTQFTTWWSKYLSGDLQVDSSLITELKGE